MKRITTARLRAYLNPEDVRWRLQKRIRKLLKKRHNKQLTNKRFTIISNNCWGGVAYDYYDVIKQSPTVGLFFMAEDYIRFCKNLRHYIDTDLTFIDPLSSRHYEYLKDLNAFGAYPVGKLDDIEIMFLHYSSPEEANEKWIRRCKRINWDKLIIKFNDQNGCTDAEAKAFLNLPYKNKLFFTVHKEWALSAYKDCYIIKQRSKDKNITASHEPYGKNSYFNLTEMINNL